MQERPARSFPFLPVILGLAVAGYVASKIGSVLTPFILSFSLAYVLSPLVANLQSRGVRREVSVVGLYLLAALATWLLATTAVDIVSQQFHDLQVQAPMYFSRVKGALLELQTAVNARLPAALAVPNKLDVHYGDVLAKLKGLPGYLLGLAPALGLIMLVPFITFFVLVDGPAGVEGAIQKCPSRYVEQALHLLSEIDASLGAYLRGLLVVALALFLASFVGLIILGVDQALAVAALTGVTSFIPYVGAVVGAVVGAAAAFVQFGTGAAAVKVLLLFTGIRLFDELVLGPLVAKHSVKLHPLIFLLCFMVGGDLFGFLGLVFAVPVACIIKALVEVAWAWYSSERQLLVHPSHDAAPIPYT